MCGFNKEDVLSACKSVGFTTGFFSIDAGAGVHHYILQESGKVTDVDKEIEQLNNMNWIEADSISQKWELSAYFMTI